MLVRARKEGLRVARTNGSKLAVIKRFKDRSKGYVSRMSAYGDIFVAIGVKKAKICNRPNGKLLHSFDHSSLIADVTVNEKCDVYGGIGGKLFVRKICDVYKTEHAINISKFHLDPASYQMICSVPFLSSDIVMAVTGYAVIFFYFIANRFLYLSLEIQIRASFYEGFRTEPRPGLLESSPQIMRYIPDSKGS